MRQVKIFSGKSLNIEEDINNWLKNNKNYNVVDIKIFRIKDNVCSLVIYEVEN